MRLIKLMMVCSIFVLGFAISSCTKEDFISRDTSGILPPPPEPPAPVDPTLVVFDNADLKDGWQTVGDPVIETVGKQEGLAYLKNTIVNGGDFMQFIKHLPAPLDSKLTMDNGQFSFYWFISDVAAIKEDGQIEITSGGDADKDELAWSVAKLLPTLKNGWNQVNLNFKDADVSGVPNLAALNFFRVFFWTKSKDHADVATGVDGLIVRAAPALPPGTEVYFDHVDVKDGWQTVGDPVIETVGKKEGTGYLKNTITNGGDFMQFIKHLPAPLNSTFTNANGQFSFWWYISDVSAIKADGQIEITSGGDADKDEYAWSVAKLLPTLKNGWNEVKLNFRDADISGSPNPAAVNFFRVFFWTKSADHPDVITGVDGLLFRAVAPAPAFSLDNADSKDGWETVGAPVIDIVGKKEGTGYLKNTIPNGGDFMQFIRKFATPVNITFTKANGQFKFWWYIADVSNIKKDGSIEITSGGDADKHENAWDVAPLVDGLHNGWNEISLDLDKSIATDDGGADLAAINYFRIFFFTTSKDHPDVVVGIDDLRFTGK